MSKAEADTLHGSQDRLIPASSSVPANITGGIWRDLCLGQCTKYCPGIFSVPGIFGDDSKINLLRDVPISITNLPATEKQLIRSLRQLELKELS